VLFNKMQASPTLTSWQARVVFPGTSGNTITNFFTNSAIASLVDDLALPPGFVKHHNSGA